MKEGEWGGRGESISISSLCDNDLTDDAGMKKEPQDIFYTSKHDEKREKGLCQCNSTCAGKEQREFLQRFLRLIELVLEGVFPSPARLHSFFSPMIALAIAPTQASATSDVAPGRTGTTRVSAIMTGVRAAGGEVRFHRADHDKKHPRDAIKAPGKWWAVQFKTTAELCN